MSSDSFSQFVERRAPYLHLNRLGECVELHRILAAGDGLSFDEHFEAIAERNRRPDYGVTPAIDSGVRDELEQRPSRRYPRSFALYTEMAEVCGKEAFVEALMAPSAVRLPPGIRCGVELKLADFDVAAMRADFDQEHLFALPAVVNPEVLSELADVALAAPFREMLHDSLGDDYTMDFPALQAALHYLVTDARLIALLCRVARIPPDGFNLFSGRVYRMIPGRDRDVYHNDIHLTDKRLIALSLSLEPEGCDGGELLLRRARWRRHFAAAPVPNRGGLVAFRLSRQLEHKVAPVRSGMRTNLAGWLCAPRSMNYGAWADRKLFEDEPQGLGRWWKRWWATR